MILITNIIYRYADNLAAKYQEAFLKKDKITQRQILLDVWYSMPDVKDEQQKRDFYIISEALKDA